MTIYFQHATKENKKLGVWYSYQYLVPNVGDYVELKNEQNTFTTYKIIKRIFNENNHITMHVIGIDGYI